MKGPYIWSLIHLHHIILGLGYHSSKVIQFCLQWCTKKLSNIENITLGPLFLVGESYYPGPGENDISLDTISYLLVLPILYETTLSFTTFAFAS